MPNRNTTCDRDSSAAAQTSLVPLSTRLAPYRYEWPRVALAAAPGWSLDAGGVAYSRSLPETRGELALDSRWPALFPSPICLVTIGDGSVAALERVVGASIVNRFPYIVALSFCRDRLSDRHYVRGRFMDLLERSEEAAVQFIPPGDALDRAMRAIASLPDARTTERVSQTGMLVRPGRTNRAPVFADAHLVYEARLVRPGRDLQGTPIHPQPWTDVGSHRVYYLEITAIQLRADVAGGRRHIRWRSLPAWRPARSRTDRRASAIPGAGYQKPYSANYVFPSAATIGFEADETHDGMAIKYLPPLAEDQVEIDNDRARWPCFFPSSLGMITSWDAPDVPNVMPCGSTTIVSRHPLVVAPCISYAAINARYAPRATLAAIRRRGRFGCGVPFIDDAVLGAIRYCGNVSVRDNPNKVSDAGLDVEMCDWAPIVSALPVHFECEVAGEVRLGTHVMFLGEVRRIRVDADVTPANPIEWSPWADVE